MLEDARRTGAVSGVDMLLVAWGIIWRMTVGGLLAGLSLGVLYGCVITFPVGGAFGGILGGVAGFVSGLFSGLLMATITLAARSRFHNSSHYVKAVGIVPVAAILLVEIVLVSLGVASDWQQYTHPGGWQDFLALEMSRLFNNAWVLFVYYVPGLISLVPAFYVGRRVARWAAGKAAMGF